MVEPQTDGRPFMSQEIEINDLICPILTDAHKAALAYGETLDIPLNEDAVLDHARRRTGFTDFGPDDFRERLNLLLDEWNADSDMNNLQRASLFGYVARYAANRLLIHDVLKRHPEIHEQSIERPVIVAGLPRSGTTHLVNLLAADTRLHSLPLWESYEPVPLPGEPMLPDGTDPRYARCAEAWERMKTATPLIASMHPMKPDHIHEELELMGPDFASYNFEWISFVPGWRDHYYATDQTPHYEYMKTALKILQWKRGKKRWVLKCPQHLEQLPVLKAVFPDATLAITHRDPVAVIQSAITMNTYGQRLSRKRITPQQTLDYWTDRIDHLLQACVRDRHIWPAAQSVDVPFHEFMADDIGMAEKILNKAALPPTEQTRAELKTFMQDHPRGKEGRIKYNLARDFGVTPEELRKRFAYYFDASPAKAEAR